MSKKNRKYQASIQSATSGLAAKAANASVKDGFVIGMTAAPTLRNVLESGRDPQENGAVLNAAEMNLAGLEFKGANPDRFETKKNAFVFGKNRFVSADSEMIQVADIGDASIDSELDQEMSRMQDIIAEGRGESHLLSMPGGKELRAFMDEAMSDITREVTFLSSVSEFGFDANWTSRVEIWIKDREAKPDERQWQFDRALIAEPDVQSNAFKELEMAMKMRLAKECEDEQYCEGAITIWITPIKSKQAFFFWTRHALGASVCGMMSAKGNVQLLMNGERGCALMSKKVIFSKKSDANLRWEKMSASLLAHTASTRKSEVLAALETAGIKTEGLEIDSAAMDRALNAILPAADLGRFLSTGASLVGNDLVTELHLQNNWFISSIDELIISFKKDIEEEKKAHDGMREREKKRFLKDLESREQFNKGVTDRANRLDVENRKLRSDLAKAQTSSSSSAATSVGPHGASRLAIALDEVFA